MRAMLGTIMCKFGGDPAICLREKATFVKSENIVQFRQELPEKKHFKEKIMTSPL